MPYKAPPTSNRGVRSRSRSSNGSRRRSRSRSPGGRGRDRKPRRDVPNLRASLLAHLFQAADKDDADFDHDHFEDALKREGLYTQQDGRLGSKLPAGATPSADQMLGLLKSLDKQHYVPTRPRENLKKVMETYVDLLKSYGVPSSSEPIDWIAKHSPVDARQHQLDLVREAYFQDYIPQASYCFGPPGQRPPPSSYLVRDALLSTLPASYDTKGWCAGSRQGQGRGGFAQQHTNTQRYAQQPYKPYQGGGRGRGRGRGRGAGPKTCFTCGSQYGGPPGSGIKCHNPACDTHMFPNANPLPRQPQQRQQPFPQQQHAQFGNFRPW